MNELIKIEERNGIQTVNARDLWEGLESKRDFPTWFKDKIIDFVDGQDFTTIPGKSTRGRPAIDYYLTIDTAKHIAMLERNERGHAIRQYFIEVENRSRLVSFPTGSELIALALVEATKYLEAKDKKIAEMEPKAAFFDQVADSKTAIEFRTAAAVLNIDGFGRNNLFEFLREQGVLDEKNIPYRQFQDRGYFRVVEQSWTDDKGETHITFKTLVYQKGLEFIRKLIKKAVAA